MILDQLEKEEMERMDCRSRCYDNAAVISGHISGVRKRIIDKNHLATYNNCDNHSLNLVGVHAAREDSIMVTFFGSIQTMYVFFSNSTQRWEKLKEAVPVVVKSESETRWSARVEAIKPINNHLAEMVKLYSDQNQSSETKTEAKQIVNRMLAYVFLSLVGFWNQILIHIDRVQKRLQDRKMNFHDAALDLKGLRDHFNSTRDSLVSDSTNEGLRLCQDWNVEASRQKRGKTMAGEKSEDEMLTAQQEMGRVMKGTLDRIIQEIDKRFIRLLDLDDKFGFLLDVEKLCYAEVNDYDL